MNIFETYLKKIQNLITINCKVLNIEPDINMDGIVVETPPLEFNFDLSTNIALVLAKKTILFCFWKNRCLEKTLRLPLTVNKGYCNIMVIAAHHDHQGVPFFQCQFPLQKENDQGNFYCQVKFQMICLF